MSLATSRALQLLVITAHLLDQSMSTSMCVTASGSLCSAEDSTGEAATAAAAAGLLLEAAAGGSGTVGDAVPAAVHTTSAVLYS
jgi:hypothetical protein